VIYKNQVRRKLQVLEQMFSLFFNIASLQAEYWVSDLFPAEEK
jgi:hypothetical protein